MHGLGWSPRDRTAPCPCPRYLLEQPFIYKKMDLIPSTFCESPLEKKNDPGSVQARQRPTSHPTRGSRAAAASAPKARLAPPFTGPRVHRPGGDVGRGGGSGGRGARSPTCRSSPPGPRRRTGPERSQPRPAAGARPGSGAAPAEKRRLAEAEGAQREGLLLPGDPGPLPRPRMGSPWPRQAARSSPEPGLAKPAPPPWPRSSLAGHPRAWPSPKCTPDVRGWGRHPLPCTSALTAAPGREAGARSVTFTPPTCCRPWPSGPWCGPRRGCAGGSPRVAEPPARAPAFTSAQVAVSWVPVRPSPALFSPHTRHPDVSPGHGHFGSLGSKHTGTRGRQEALRKRPETPLVATVPGHPQSRSPRLAPESEHPPVEDGAP